MYRRVLPVFLVSLAMAPSLGAQQPFSTRIPSGSDTAQQRPGDQETPAQLERTENMRLALDEFLVLVPFRLEDDIRADIESSRIAEQKAESEKREAERLERLAKDQLEAQKREIDAIKARIKVAKSDGRDAEVTILETDKKLAEGAKQLLEKRRDLRRKEIDGWDTVSRLAEETRRAAELELELANARGELRERGNGASAEEVRRLERRVNELEKRTLEAQKKRADWRGRVADTEEDVVSSRLQLLKTRAKIDAGG
jgi:chromosome segregation ATPase